MFSRSISEVRVRKKKEAKHAEDADDHDVQRSQLLTLFLDYFAERKLCQQRRGMRFLQAVEYWNVAWRRVARRGEWAGVRWRWDGVCD